MGGGGGVPQEMAYKRSFLLTVMKNKKKSINN